MSQSKRRSSSRRKKRKSESGAGFGKSASESGKSSFIALVAGMTTTFALAMWLYSVLFLDLPVRKPRPRTPAPTLAATTSKFDSFLKSASPEQLITRLTEQRNEINKAKNATERAYLLEKQIEVAKRIAESETTRDVKDFSTRTLLRSRKSLYGLHALGRIPSQASSDSFKACFEKYLNDTNREVYREAHICRLTFVLFEVIAGKLESNAFTQSLEETLKRFPSDEVVLGSIRKQFDACIENDVETAKRLGEDLLRSAPDKDHPAADLYLYFLDRYYLIKANYNDLYLNRYANGKAGQRELEKQSIELLEHDDCGQVVVVDVNKVANWFEGQRDSLPAQKIYQSMVECSARRPESKIGKLLETLGSNGLKRLEQIGKPFSLAGVKNLESPIDEQLFKNRVVMILFYSPTGGATSTEYLKRFTEVGSNFSKNSAPVKAIAVPTSPISQIDLATIQRSKSSTVFCDWNGSQQPVLLERFPVTQVPYLLMLNHEGVISSVNVPIDEFEQEAGLLLDRR